LIGSDKSARSRSKRWFSGGGRNAPGGGGIGARPAVQRPARRAAAHPPPSCRPRVGRSGAASISRPSSAPAFRDEVVPDDSVASRKRDCRRREGRAGARQPTGRASPRTAGDASRRRRRAGLSAISRAAAGKVLFCYGYEARASRGEPFRDRNELFRLYWR
jgi:hypothetical protein